LEQDGLCADSVDVSWLGNLAWNGAWFVIGLGLAVPNMIRHRLLGYTRPRPFRSDELGRTIDHELEVVDNWRKCGLDPRGRRILELGPGPDLGTGFILVALGAESYMAVDRFPLAAHDNHLLYEALAERLGVSAGPTLERMRYVVSPPPGPVGHSAVFDAFVSNATLEHISDIPSTFAWMKSHAMPGSIHVHLVDAQTHMRWIRPRDPWNILRYPGWIFRLTGFAGVPNRMLASDYVAHAERFGVALSVVEGQHAGEAYLRRIRPFLARSFRDRSRSDLALLTFTLVGGVP
jgi:hypothetical protein